VSHADAAPIFRLAAVDMTAPDGTRILRGVDLTLPADRTTVIVGPSGAGKSTLLRLLNRLEVPSAGSITFRGTAVSELNPRAHRRRVGMVFQRPVTFPGTVAENLAEADPAATLDAQRDVLEAVGLPVALLARTADALSGGEAQRMCMARALLTQPDVLLLDEPTSALDEDSRNEVEELTSRLRERGVALVWVTHDQEQAARRGDYVVAMEAGRIVFAGHVDEARAAGHLRPGDSPGFTSASGAAI
jgi:putative ABC transport system ATP-binding protein